MRRELVAFKLFHCLPDGASSPVSTFIIAFLSSLDLALCYIEGGLILARTHLVLPLLHTGITLLFQGVRSCAKSEILSQPEDPGIPESLSLSSLPSMMSRRESSSQIKGRRSRKGRTKRKGRGREGKFVTLFKGCLTPRTKSISAVKNSF